MKKTYIALIGIVAGLLLIALGSKLSGHKGITINISDDKQAAKELGNDERKTYECPSGVTCIDIDETSNTVIVEIGSVSVPTISYIEGETTGELVIKESGNSVTLERKNHKSINIPFMDFTNTDTIVTLPKSYDKTLLLNTTSGSIKAEGSTSLQEFSAKSTSGTVSAKDIDVKESMEFITTSGSIHLESLTSGSNFSAGSTSGTISVDAVKAGADVRVTATSGSVHINGMEADGDIEIGTTSGSIDPDDVTAKGSVDFQNTSGGISFKNLSVAGDITLDSNSGSIRGNILGKESDYSIISSTTSGSCNLTDSRSGDKNLDVSTTSGSIHITFK